MPCKGRRTAIFQEQQIYVDKTIITQASYTERNTGDG